MLGVSRRDFAAGAMALGVALTAPGASAGVLEDMFSKSTAGSSIRIDHAVWTEMLQAYVVAGPDKLNRVRYAAWKAEGRPKLTAYIAALERVDVAQLDRPEQFAFWANLYNAKTVDIVLAQYPVKSIKDISLGGTLLSNITGGPWKAKVTTVAGQSLSLDDIEHVILRPLFKDPRVHYAVNCASVGCPNLRREAFTGAVLETQLDASARDYVNTPRGLRVDAKGKITASSIYTWFQADFGGTVAGVLEHVRRYADAPLAAALVKATAIDDYAYDWSLNDATR